ncbi:hypothetical protein TrLO_g11445 [Triparma laevis f. longispina]|nr:hypothetical protein TrLO_g11445 [Triparma laevis f. longispina]
MPSKISEKATHAFALVSLVYSVLLGLSLGTKKGWRLFTYHPLLLTVATSIFVIAAMYKKIGGLQYTRLHGNLSFLGLCLVLGGVSAIYYNKEWNAHSSHFESNHALLGGSVLSIMCILLLNGLIAIHPDWGKLKTNKTIRLAHKMTGRFILVSMCFAIWQGAKKVAPGFYETDVAVGVPAAFWAFLLFWA